MLLRCRPPSLGGSASSDHHSPSAELRSPPAYSARPRLLRRKHRRAKILPPLESPRKISRRLLHTAREFRCPLIPAERIARSGRDQTQLFRPSPWLTDESCPRRTAARYRGRESRLQ